jgi:hypothetical protein
MLKANHSNGRLNLDFNLQIMGSAGFRASEWPAAADWKSDGAVGY